MRRNLFIEPCVKQRSPDILKVVVPAIIRKCFLKEILRHIDRGVMLDFLVHEAVVWSFARQINFDVIVSGGDQIIMHCRLLSRYGLPHSRFQGIRL
jgi:predicted DNA-binding protein (UPF0278 family)